MGVEYNKDEIDEILRRYTTLDDDTKSESKTEVVKETKSEAVVESSKETEKETDKDIVEEIKEEESKTEQQKKLSLNSKTSSAKPSMGTGSAPVKVSKMELMKKQAELREQEEGQKEPKNKPVEKKSTEKETEKKPEKKKADNKKNQGKKKKTKKDTVLNILLVVFILTFLISGGYIAMYYYNIHKAEKSFDSLKGMIKDTDGDVVIYNDSSPTDAEQIKYVNIDGVDVQEKFADLYSSNHDFIGWLTVPGTEIDYPVMHTPQDEEFYLHKDFSKEKSSSGTLFVAAKCSPLAPSDNVVIYGHNMKAGTMFHDLLKYETEDYYKSHKTFRFDTIQGNYEYEVIAAFRTEIKGEDDTFKYYEFIDSADEEAFDDYVSNVKSKTPYKIEETAKYGDKLVTLSTCAYHAKEGRYVVVAKRK